MRRDAHSSLTGTPGPHFQAFASGTRHQHCGVRGRVYW